MSYLSKCHNAPTVVIKGNLWDVDPESMTRGSTYGYGCTECHKACDVASSESETPPNTDPLEAIDEILKDYIARLEQTNKGVEIIWHPLDIANTRLSFQSLLQQEKKEAERLGRIDEQKNLGYDKRLDNPILWCGGSEPISQAERLKKLNSPPNTEQEQS